MAVSGFIHQPSPQRVLFGQGTLAQLSDEAARLDLKRALVLSTPGHEQLAGDTARLLGSACGGVFAGA